MRPYYQDDRAGITIYHGDCLEIMPHLAAGAFDATITDPPYGTTACAWDSVIPFGPMWAQLKRLGTPRAAHVLFGSQPFTSALIASNFEMFKYSWVWEKNKATGHLRAESAPLKAHEDITVFSFGVPPYNPQKEQGEPYRPRGGRVAGKDGAYGVLGKDRNGSQDGTRYPRSILSYGYNCGLHPTQKPLALMEYLIKTYTNEGDTILDFTCGSGTTLRAAKNLKRRAVGIEQDRHYCEVTVNRLAPAFEAALVDTGASLKDLPLFANLESEE